MFRHVAVMSSTAAIGLVAVFAVDLVNLLYISLLGEKAIAAAVGFSGVLGFFQTSICIGLTIAVAALVSQNIGAGRMREARRMATSSLVFSAGIALLVAATTLLVLHPLLALLGARGEVERLTAGYLLITVSSLPLLAIGMGCAAILRCVGDARRAMWVTLGAAFLTAGVDPLLIFGAGWGLNGAAVAAVLARCMLAGVGLHGVVRKHRLLARIRVDALPSDFAALARVAGPAVLSNLATPVGAAFVTRGISQFGAAAVAGQATIDRLSPVAFGLVYALSGAIGPILGQNFGGRRFDRVSEALRDSIRFMVMAVAVAWAVLALAQDGIVLVFSLNGQAAALVRAYCSWLCASFFFVGALFVSNAAFNNLGRPLWSTAFNWARATLGTIPLAWWGARYGPVGVIAGQAIGSAVFGSLALLVAFRHVRAIAKDREPAAASPSLATLSTPPAKP